MKKQNIQGLENAPKIMQDFVLSLDKNKTFRMQKHNKKIIKWVTPIYELSIYFIIGAIFVAGLVEVYCA